jgi:hypothetical protein
MKNRFLNIALLFFLITVSESAFAWNVIDSATRGGKANSPNICRNLNNNGSLSASVWVKDSASTSIAGIRFFEVDDNGMKINEKLFRLTYPLGGGGTVKRIELHRILVNYNSNSYVVLGTAHKPSPGFPTTQAFLFEVDNSLNKRKVKFLDEYFNYYDFTITPLTGQVACVGTIGIFNRLKVPSRRGVITTLDSNFSCTGLNLMEQSLPGVGNIPRFDNIKVIKSYLDAGSNQEFLFISGHITRDSTNAGITNFIPQVFVSKLLINNLGGLTNLWYRVLNSHFSIFSPMDQVVPCDLLYDENRSFLVLVSSSNDLLISAFENAQLTILDANSGILMNNRSFRGPGISSAIIPNTNMVYAQSICLKSNGNYCIQGWADNYYNGAIGLLNRFNFYQVDFNPDSLYFDSMQLVLGTSAGYVATQPRDFYGIFTDTGYTHGSTFHSLGLYCTPHAMTCFIDSNGNDQSVIAWISTETAINNKLRLWSSKNGRGDDLLGCKLPKLEVIATSNNVIAELRSINWDYVPCYDFPVGGDYQIQIDLNTQDCNGTYD